MQKLSSTLYQRVPLAERALMVPAGRTKFEILSEPHTAVLGHFTHNHPSLQRSPAYMSTDPILP